MNPQSKLLLVIGIFVFSTSCFGQRPSCEKLIVHFAADIIKVDSILSRSSHCNGQRTSNIPSRSLPFDKINIRIELNRDKGDWNRESFCPVILEMDRPKKI
jgi:hypothetical protein